jgi:septal ring factor EnvC (AmiA/AmiB activator)
MTKRGYIVSALCVCALLSQQLSCTPASAAEATVSVPLSRLIELRTLTDRQELRLIQLQELLDAQSSTLSKQQSSIRQLRQELQTAKSSLSSSKQIIDEQNASLMSLSESIRQEQRRTRRIERQRLLWQIIAGSVVVYAALK